MLVCAKLDLAKSYDPKRSVVLKISLRGLGSACDEMLRELCYFRAYAATICSTSVSKQQVL